MAWQSCGRVTLQVVGHLDYYLGVRNLSTVINDTLSTHVENYDPELAAAIVQELGGVNLTVTLQEAEVRRAGGGGERGLGLWLSQQS